MKTYQRNQVEEATIAMLGGGEDEVARQLRAQMKRLLDADRKAARADQQGFAFTTGKPPGTGYETQFAAGDAFALVVGVQMLRHRWKQGAILWHLRAVKTDIRRAYDWVLKHDRKKLFDQRKPAPGAIPGSNLAQLVIVEDAAGDSDPRAEGLTVWIDRQERRYWKSVHRGEFLAKPMTIFPLDALCFLLTDALNNTIPLPRGRKSI